LVKEKCFHVYENLEIPLVDVLARMECQGIKIDKKILSQLSETFAKNLKVFRKKNLQNCWRRV
jgi:DNA polymerase-1